MSIVKEISRICCGDRFAASLLLVISLLCFSCSMVMVLQQSGVSNFDGVLTGTVGLLAAQWGAYSLAVESY